MEEQKKGLIYEVKKGEKIIGEYQSTTFPTPTSKIKVGTRNYTVESVDLLEDKKTKKNRRVINVVV